MAETEESEYLINIENNLVSKEKIDIKDKNFEKVMFLYRAALKEIKTKIDILQEEMKLFSDYEPVEYVITRLKKPESIISKLERKNLSLTYQNMFDNIDDIAGLRIVCNFKSDVYKLVDIISGFQDVKILYKKAPDFAPELLSNYKLLRKVAINITGESTSNISGVYCNA